MSDECEKTEDQADEFVDLDSTIVRMGWDASLKIFLTLIRGIDSWFDDDGEPRWSGKSDNLFIMADVSVSMAIHLVGEYLEKCEKARLKEGDSNGQAS